MPSSGQAILPIAHLLANIVMAKLQTKDDLKMTTSKMPFIEKFQVPEPRKASANRG